MIEVSLKFFETIEEYCEFMRDVCNLDGDLRIVAHASKPVDTCTFLSHCIGYAEPYCGRYGVGFKVVINSKKRYPKKPVKNNRIIYVTDGYYFGSADKEDASWRQPPSTRKTMPWEF